MKKFSLFLLLLFLIFNFFGCSSKSINEPVQNSKTQEVSIEADDDEFSDFADEFEVKEIYDPFRSYNRFMTGFNDGAYEYVLKPVAKGYKVVLHEEIRISVSNFFHNIYFPVRFANNLLQVKFCNASEEAARFIVNSTVGILGLFDPAKSWYGLDKHEEDFGQTLGFYGVGSGPHIVLPLLGPSNLRDLVGLYPDTFLSPINIDESNPWTITHSFESYFAAKSLEYVNYMSLNMDRYDKMKEDAVDLYPYLRDMYEQYRDNKIKE